MAQNQNINININANTSGLSGAATRTVSAFRTMGTAANNFGKVLNGLNASMGRLGQIGIRGPMQGLGAIGNSIQRINRYFSEHNKTLALSATYYKGLVGQVSNLNRFINVLGSSVRQIGQGLQNFATVFSLYVSAPVAIFIRNMTGGLIEFQDRLIEVRRTTGLTLESVDRLGKLIQEISLTSPTPVEDLATMAAAWGRLGVTGVDAIAKLTSASDKMMNATSLTSDQVVDDLGKIGSLYYDTADDLAGAYENLGSAINELGQASPLSESDIIGSALRAAPTARQLGISLPDLLGISTTVAERAASPERAGSQLSRALTQNTSNVEAFAKALGTTTDEVKSLIDTDAAGFFFDVLEAMQDIPSAADRIAIGNALFGGVGEKAVNALAANLPGLYDNLALANEAFKDGTSLQREYERSLDSVKNQLGILQNNFRYLGFTIAEQVLPYITKFATAAIPALRMAAEAFGNLSERTKLLTVGVGALIAVIGPLVLFMGSLLFSIGIITTGFTALFTQVIGVFGAIGRLGFAIFSLLAPVTLLKTAILGIGLAFVFISNTAAEAGNALAGYFGKFVQWGYNLISGFAQGIIDGAGVVYDAVMIVINSFIGLIQAFSPPREGPLRYIRTWGENLSGELAGGVEDGAPKVQQGFIKTIGEAVKGVEQGVKTYFPSIVKTVDDVGDQVADGMGDVVGNVAEGLDQVKSEIEDTVDEIIHIGAMFSESFANAIKGFSADGADLFADTFSQVRSIVESVGSNLGLDRFEIDQRVLDSADAVAELIRRVESGAGAGGGLSSIYDLMGGLGDETEDLVGIQHEYNKALEELERIKDSTGDDSDDALRREIQSIAARRDLSLNEKSALIRNARLRASQRKDDVNEEEKAAQDRVDTLADELKRRENILKTLSSLIFPAEKEKIKKESDELSTDLATAFDPGSSLEGIEKAKRDLEKLWDDAGDSVDTFLTKIDKAGEVWRGFMAGITGDYTGIDLDREGEDFWNGFIPGQKIRLAIADIKEQFDLVKESIDSAFLAAQKIYKFFEGGAVGGYLQLGAQNIEQYKTLEQVAYNIGYFFGQAALEVETLLGLLESPALDIWNNVSNAIGGEGGGGFVGRLDFNGIGASMAEAFNIVIQRYFNPGGESFSKFRDSISATVGGIVGAIGTFLMEADFMPIVESVGGVVTAILNGFMPENLNPGAISGAVTNIFNTIIRMLSSVTTGVGGDSTNLLSNILNAIIAGLASINIDEFMDSLKAIVGGILGGLADVDWLSLGTFLSDVINSFLEALGDQSLWTNLGAAFGGLINAITTTIGGLDWGLTSDVFEGLATAVGVAIKTMFSDPEGQSEWKGAITTAAGNFVIEIIETVVGVIIEALTGGFVDNIEFQDPRKGFPVQFFDDTGGQLPTIFNKEFWQSLWEGELKYLNPGQNQSVAPSVPQGSSMSPTNDTGLPLVLSPDVLKQAEEHGGEYNTSFVESINTNLQSKSSIDRISSGLDTLIMGAEEQSEPGVTQFGENIGMYTTAGAANRFAGAETQEDFATILTAMDTFIADNRNTIQDAGFTFGNHFTSGIRSRVNSPGDYMGSAISRLNGWITSPTNSNAMVDAGESFGANILRGASNVIAQSGSRLALVLQNALEGTPLTPAQINELFPYSDSTIASMSTGDIGVSAASGAGDSYVININVSGGVPTDRRALDTLANMVMDKMKKEVPIKR